MFCGLAHQLQNIYHNILILNKVNMNSFKLQLLILLLIIGQYGSATEKSPPVPSKDDVANIVNNPSKPVVATENTKKRSAAEILKSIRAKRKKADASAKRADALEAENKALDEQRKRIEEAGKKLGSF